MYLHIMMDSHLLYYLFMLSLYGLHVKQKASKKTINEEWLNKLNLQELNKIIIYQENSVGNWLRFLN